MTCRVIPAATVRRRARRKSLVACLIPLGAILLGAAAYAIDPTELPDPVLQQRYLALTHELRCVQCQ
ncbi:MAG: cytochrome c-type biogenesis protein CcmH, partial [Gammaproteobacteria bacterium]